MLIGTRKRRGLSQISSATLNDFINMEQDRYGRRAKPTGTYRRDCNLPHRDDKNTCIPSERRRLHKPKADIQSWRHVWGGVKDMEKLVKDVYGALGTVKLTSLEPRQRL